MPGELGLGPDLSQPCAGPVPALSLAAIGEGTPREQLILLLQRAMLTGHLEPFCFILEELLNIFNESIDERLLRSEISQPWPCTRAQQLCRALFGELAHATGCATALSRATAPFMSTFATGGSQGSFPASGALSCFPPPQGPQGLHSQGSPSPTLADPGPAVGSGHSTKGTTVPGCASTCLGTACSGKPFHGEESKGSCRNAQPGSGLGQPWGCCPSLRGALWSLLTVRAAGQSPLLGATSAPLAAGWVQPGWGLFGVALFCIFKPARRNTESTPGAVQATLQRLNFCCSSQNQFEEGAAPSEASMASGMGEQWTCGPAYPKATGIFQNRPQKNKKIKKKRFPGKGSLLQISLLVFVLLFFLNSPMIYDLYRRSVCAL